MGARIPSTRRWRWPGARARAAPPSSTTSPSPASDASEARSTGVSTDHGDIACEIVVNCAGMWGRQVGQMAGVNVPLHASEHFYIVTEPIGRRPRSSGASRYRRLHLRPRGSRRSAHGRLRAGGQALGHGRDSGRLRVLAAPRGLGALPSADGAGVHPHSDARRRRRCGGTSTGPRASRPTTATCWARRPRLRGFFVAAGFNSVGIAVGRRRRAGAGRVDRRRRADAWTSGTSTSAASCPSRRNARYLRERTREVLGLLYAMHWPFRQPETRARRALLSCCTTAWPPRGAVFGDGRRLGARQLVRADGVEPRYVYTYGRQNWFALRRRRASRGAQRRRPLRPDVVRQVPARGPGRRDRAAAPLRQRRRRAAGPHRLHADAATTAAASRAT